MAELEDLVERYLVEGDEVAIEEVVRLTRPRLLNAARRIVGAEEAQDCVQTAYLSLMHKRGASLEAPIVAWLLTAVVRTAYRRRAKNQKANAIAGRLADAREGDTPVTAAIDAEEAGILRCNVDRLPESYRDPVILHYFEGLSAAETGELLAISETNVRKRLQRARAMLRSGWQPRLYATLMTLPWLLADAAAAVWLLMGMLFGTKVAVAATLVLLAAVSGGVVWRAVDGSPPPERVAAADDRAPRATPAPVAVERPAPSAWPSITGRVVDEENNAIAGARVLSIPVTMRDAVDPKTHGEPVTSARSAGDGSFSVVLHGPEPGFSLHASAPGYAPAVAEAVGEPVLVLRRAASIAGTVMDMERRPVAGARVRWLGLVGGVRTEAEAVSAEDGRYGIDGIPDSLGAFGSDAWIRVEAAGFAPLTVEHTSLMRDLVLVRGARVRGMVVDGETKRPLANVRVLFWSDEASRGELRRPGGAVIRIPYGPRIVADTRSDKNGMFLLEHIPALGFHHTPGRLGAVGAMPEGYVASPVKVNFADDGGVTNVRIVCWPAAAIEGRVVDEDGSPLPDVILWAYSGERVLQWWSLRDPRDHNPVALSDEHGRFRIVRVPGLRGGPAEVKVQARPKHWPNVNLGPTAAVQVRPGQTASMPDIVIGPPRGGVADVTVVNGRDSPVFGARASLAQNGAEEYTDAAGRVHLFQHGRHGAGEPPHRVYVSAPGYACAVSAPFDFAEGAPVAVRVAMAAARTIRGRVLWKDGTPAAGVEVNALNGTLSLESGSKLGPRPPVPVYYARATADGAGGFMLEVPEGPSHVTASVIYGSNFGSKAIIATVEGVPAGTDDLVLELEAPARDGRGVIEGTVVAADTNEPFSRFRVHLYMDDRVLVAEPLSPGRFRCENVPDGVWSVGGHAEGYHWTYEKVKVENGAARMVDLRLKGGLVVRGRVRSRTVSLKGARVYFYRTNSSRWEGALDDEGRYEVKAMEPGRHAVQLSVPGVIEGMRELVLDKTVPETTFDFEAVPAGTVEVFSDFGTREELPPGIVVSDAQGQKIIETHAWQRHVFQLLPGRYKIACLDRRRRQEHFVDVVVGETKQIGFDVTPSQR